MFVDYVCIVLTLQPHPFLPIYIQTLNEVQKCVSVCVLDVSLCWCVFVWKHTMCMRCVYVIVQILRTVNAELPHDGPLFRFSSHRNS